ncbi:hypothetical protein Zmor_008239 [Zophobas morio]|uniref:Fibrinogen C-terminal domain-containing protein n=1 Tax=Zophobas morio TaxID=2755281 RepID=A0AA38IUA4_9CUCU|nr:hypothetical protein Zmor_008239 [Zophobas morio]
MWCSIIAVFAFSATILVHPSTAFTVVSTTSKSDGSNELDQLASKIEQIEHNIQTIQKVSENQNHASVKSRFPKNCKEIQTNGNTISGVYTVQPEFAPKPFLVLCNMDSHGGGWTYFMNRFNGNQDFFRRWNDYKTGFGNLNDEFWLGLDYLHFLTGYEVNELLIELEDWDSKKVYARYDAFSVGNEGEGYIMRILGNYSGTAGESLSYHGGMKFTTTDRDNDLWRDGNCAVYRSAGWWYNNCVGSHLTGKYIKEKSSADAYTVMFWNTLRGAYNIKVAKMMVKPK